MNAQRMIRVHEEMSRTRYVRKNVKRYVMEDSRGGEMSKRYVAYEGRPVQNADVEKELSKARCSVSYFGLELSEWSARVGDK